MRSPVLRCLAWLAAWLHDSAVGLQMVRVRGHRAHSAGRSDSPITAAGLPVPAERCDAVLFT